MCVCFESVLRLLNSVTWVDLETNLKNKFFCAKATAGKVSVSSISILLLKLITQQKCRDQQISARKSMRNHLQSDNKTGHIRLGIES